MGNEPLKLARSTELEGAILAVVSALFAVISAITAFKEALEAHRRREGKAHATVAKPRSYGTA